MEKVKIELNLEEINIIIDALGKQPFAKVYKLIEKLHLQANNQLKEQQDRNGKTK